MLYPLIAILLGFVLLVWSAERFVVGAAEAARHLGMPPLMIGMVIVGFGTSAPEMVVSASAAWGGNPDLALGNALGSNIVNTGLVLGLTALIAPILVQSNIVRKEIPMLLMICGLFGLFALDGALTRTEGIVLLTGFFSLLVWSGISARRTGTDHLEIEIEQHLAESQMSLKVAFGWLLCGLIMLIVSSKLLVWGAVAIAVSMGVSNLVIGLTIVALGTSLPELAASVVAALKGEHDIAIGNVVGSNMFNILAVVGIAGVISPLPQLNPEILGRDWPVVMGLTLGLWLMAYGHGRQGLLNRWEGGILLLAFVAYNIVLIRPLLAGI
ncbi:MAG: calcium/sodium antiporter [Gammaproteobacteria bacterium]|nr:calcium/sodium antiporter [Gammaproteobacteria bacterium]